MTELISKLAVMCESFLLLPEKRVLPWSICAFLLLADSTVNLSVIVLRSIRGIDRHSGWFFDVFHKDQINDAETVDEFLDFIVNEIYSELSEDGLSFAEDVVRVRNGLFYLVNRVLFLDVMKGVLQVGELQFDVLRQLIRLI